MKTCCMLVLKDLTLVLLLSIHNNQAALITSSGLVVPCLQSL